MSAVTGLIRVYLLRLENCLLKLLTHVVDCGGWKEVSVTQNVDFSIGLVECSQKLADRFIAGDSRKIKVEAFLLWPTFKVAPSFPTIIIHWLPRAAPLSVGKATQKYEYQEMRIIGNYPWGWLLKRWKYVLNVALEIKEYLVHFQEQWYHNSEKSKNKATTEKKSTFRGAEREFMK